MWWSFVEQCPEGVREKNRWGETPLHRAPQGGRVVVRLLVESWPEGKDHTGKTPLSLLEMVCVSWRELQVCDEQAEKIIALLGGSYPEATGA
jgi:hypothetical protein